MSVRTGLQVGPELCIAPSPAVVAVSEEGERAARGELRSGQRWPRANSLHGRVMAVGQSRPRSLASLDMVRRARPWRRQPRSLSRSALRAARDGQALTPETCRQLVNENVIAGQDGTLTPDQIHIVVFQRYAALRLAPLCKVIDDVLAARGVALPTQ